MNGKEKEKHNENDNLADNGNFVHNVPRIHPYEESSDKYKRWHS